MIFLEVLVEGASDVPAAREVLTRKLGLVEREQFRIHPHRGKGRLPPNPRARPDPRRRGLLDQLPAKLRGYAHLPPGYGVVVLVDADDDDCVALRRELVALLDVLPAAPRTVLFRIAVEETESWFIAEPDAVSRAYPRADLRAIRKVPPDAVVGAWERLAEALGRRPAACTGADKVAWAEPITPGLDLDTPRSPSLRAFVAGAQALVDRLVAEGDHP